MKDPENRYYSYASRLRLTAELTRDHVLASSGLLVREIGGPSVKPYQPAGIWESTTSGRGELARYVQDHGNKLYRRGMYTFIKRTAPPPSLLIFDAGNRDQCEVTRLRTNTPLAGTRDAQRSAGTRSIQGFGGNTHGVPIYR